jgi:hypothetical protein
VNAAELENLSTQIMRSWPKMLIGPDIWEEALAPFDAGAAGTALVRLRNETKFPPSIQEFVSTIRSLGPTGPRRDTHDCPRCGGDGLITMVQRIHDVEYEVQTPCLCEHGEDARAMLDKITAANTEVLGRGQARVPAGVPYPRDQRKAVMAHGTIV